jgi:hypothetical protein
MYLTILNYTTGVTIIEKTKITDYEKIEKYLENKFPKCEFHFMISKKIKINV